jgi:hypothetical protein
MSNLDAGSLTALYMVAFFGIAALVIVWIIFPFVVISALRKQNRLLASLVKISRDKKDKPQSN